ncbi:MAG: glycosyltransferase [Candidatus Sericytochromatia bacterium]|nr:glycosyltransferase [Candidatus Sericytochromatia bacterium]
MFSILLLPTTPSLLPHVLKAWAWQNLPRSEFEVWVVLPEGENSADIDWPNGLAGGVLSPEQAKALGSSKPARDILLWEADFRPHRDLLWQFKAARTTEPAGLLQAVGTWPTPLPAIWQEILTQADMPPPFQPDAFDSRVLAPDEAFASGLLLPSEAFQALLQAQPDFLSQDRPEACIQSLHHWLQTQPPSASQTVHLIPSARATCLKSPTPHSAESAQAKPLPIWGPPPCPLKLLVGPLPDPALLGDYLYSPNVKTFTARPFARLLSQAANYPLEAYDLSFDLNQDHFEDLFKPLPAAWQPDLILWLAPAVQGLPPGIEESPVPVVALVHDWHSQGLGTLLDCATDFDWLFCDQSLQAILTAAGHQHLSYWPCYGLDPERSYALPWQPEPVPEKGPRPYAVGFVGTLASPYYPERERLLAEVALLNAQWPVLLADGISDPHEYNRLLNQCQVVLNPSARGEMNLRAYEAPAAGALLLSEASNREIRAFLPEDESGSGAALFFEPESLSQTLAKILADPVRLARLAQNGQRAIQAHSYTAQWGQLLSQLMQHWPKIQAMRQIRHQIRHQIRAPQSATPPLRSWITARQLYFSRTPGGVERAERVLAQAIATPKRDSDLSQTSTSAQIRLLKYTQALFQINQAVDFAQAERAGQAQKRLWEILSPEQRAAFTRGLKHLSELMNETPSPFLAYHLGWTAGYLQDYAQARQHLQKALSLPFPESPSDPHYRLILPLGHSGKLIPHFQMAYARRLQTLSLNSGLASAANASAWPLQALILSQIAQLQGHALRAEKQPALAQEAYLAALQLYPESPELTWLLAQSAMEMGQAAKAEILLAELVASHPLTFPYRWEWLRLLKTLQSPKYPQALQASRALLKGINNPYGNDYTQALEWLETELKA